jgi:tryptophan synthase alpha chain
MNRKEENSVNNIPKTNRIATAFDHGTAFIAFLTGGDPTPATSESLIMAMIESGADLIEIGIPFSDPIAEGQVIQEANIRALAAGTTVDRIFDIVIGVRRKSEIPIVFLTYLNPVFHYGYDAFFAKCASHGVDGLIIPDLPFEEQAEVKSVASKYGIAIVSLIAPTSEDRIKTIAAYAEGFVYIVSSMGVTGVRSEIQTDISKIVSAVKSVAKVPAAVGFGIHTPQQAREIGANADGVIVGSAIVKIIAEHGEQAEPYLKEYIKTMKAATSGSR